MIGRQNFGLILASAVSACLIPMASTPCLAKDSRSVVPVLVGGYADEDACGAQGVVTRTRSRESALLSVRAGPNARRFGRVGHLRSGESVAICEQRDGWLSIVYGRHSQDCGVSKPIAVRVRYGGPCRSGWVKASRIRLRAG